jgi:hypothetical protein
VGGAVLVGTAATVVGVWLVAGTIVVAAAAVVVVSVLLLHAEATRSAATTPVRTLFMMRVVPLLPRGSGGAVGVLGCRYA